MTDDMKLPEGRTCQDCQHMRRCEWLVGRKGTETTCDWSPSRFRLAVVPSQEEQR